MAISRQIRRLVRRARPVVRRAPSASAVAARKEAKRDMSGDSALMIGRIKDPSEKAADQMANRVMCMPAAGPIMHRQFQVSESEDKQVQRVAEETENEETVKAKSAPNTAVVSAGAGATPVSHRASKAIRSMGDGKPLAYADRAFFEPRFGADLSSVRIHDGLAADKASKYINARAFTLGNEIAFAKGEHQPETDRGRRLMAHELSHVVQDRAKAWRQVRRAFGKCTSKTDENSIVTSHTVSNEKIKNPGDKANIAVTFSCKPRSFDSEIVDSGGSVISSKEKTIWNGKFKPDASGRWTTSWNGKRSFKKVGTFLADDGVYKHRISDLAYSPGAKGDLKAKIGGVLSESPKITVAVRKEVSEKRTLSAADKTGALLAVPKDMRAIIKHLNLGESKHLLDPGGKIRQKNIEELATAIHSEAEGCSTAEHQAIAWAIRNEMVRINSYEVSDAKAVFKFADNKKGTKSDQKIAADVLAKKMSMDPTGKAIKWYSPKIMPPHRGKCKSDGGKYDCSGGTVTLTDGSKKSSKAPGFHLHMTFVKVPGVNQWNFRFYKL